MRKSTVALSIILSAFLTHSMGQHPLQLNAASMQEAGSNNDALRRDLTIAKQRVYPALVNISVIERDYQNGHEVRNPAGGSGVIITSTGYVVTNFHVAGHTTHIVCTLTTGEAINADVVADDSLTDLSILKLRLKDRKSQTPLPYAKLGNSDNLQVGDIVLAMGNPLMLSSSMTMGIVSNTKRVFMNFTGSQLENMELERGERTGLYTRWIQHDALILPGNSGGPLVNLKGEVVGINELGGEGAGFAIPSNLVSAVFNQVMKHGAVVRGDIGISVMPVNKVGRTTGALISNVIPDSPADKAGLKAGDILLSIGNSPANVVYFEEAPLLYEKIAEIPVGSKIALQALRKGKKQTFYAVIRRLPPFLGEEQDVKFMGVTVRDITPSVAVSHNLGNKSGVIITGIRAGYPFEAAEPRIQAGDVITSIAGKNIANVSDFRKIINKQKGNQFLVSIIRNDENIITLVKSQDTKTTQDGLELPKSWIGIKTQVMTQDISAALGMPDQTGLRVTKVLPWTEASKSGFKTGDIITSLNNTKLESSSLQDADDLIHAIEEIPVGMKVSLGVLRDKKPISISLITEGAPKSSTQTDIAQQKELDFSARDITLNDRASNHWSKEQKGVLVTEVIPGGWANIADLEPDDLIVSINDQQTSSINEFTKIMKSVIRNKPQIIKVFIRRDSQTQFVFIEPDWTRLEISE